MCVWPVQRVVCVAEVVCGAVGLASALVVALVGKAALAESVMEGMAVEMMVVAGMVAVGW